MRKIYFLLTIIFFTVAIFAGDAGRLDEASKHDKSRALLYPMTFAEIADYVEKNIAVVKRKPEIYHAGENGKIAWIDLNKNGKKDIYEDATQTVDARIADLLAQMTMEEKTMQLVTLYGYNRVTPDFLPTVAWKNELVKDGIGNIDEHLNGFNYHDNENLPGVWFLKSADRLAFGLNETRRFFIEDTRLGIPCEFTNEGLRGMESTVSTGFPCALAQGSTWNRELIRAIAKVAGRESFVVGYDNLYAPLLDVIRDPRWGRCEEMFAECPWLVGEYGVDVVNAIQAEGVTSSPKHYCIYSSAIGARQGFSRVDPHTTPRENEYIHLAAWRKVMRDAKPDGVMISYNDYDGEPMASSKFYMLDVLRGEMGFDGYTVSDSDAVEYLYTKHRVAESPKEAVRQTILGGMDVRTTFTPPETYILPLRELIAENKVPMSVVDERVKNVLRVKFRRGLFDNPYRDLQVAKNETWSKESQDLSLRASREAIILLKNADKFLPLDVNKISTIAVCGPNADSVEYARQHYGPLCNPTITVKKALENYGDGKFKVLYARGCDFVDANYPHSEILPFAPNDAEMQELNAAIENAKHADLTVIVVGDTPYGSKTPPNKTTCGENNSRTSLELAGHQNLLISEIAKMGAPFVVVHFSGRPNALNLADKIAPAILHSFLPGPFGGVAAVEAIFGEINPSGKTPTNFVKTTGQLPLNFPAKPGANTESNRAVNGYLYPFGFGLSYTTFAYKNLNIAPEKIAANGKIVVSFEITNTGDRDGTEIAQLYYRKPFTTLTEYEQQLRGFARVELKVGETKRVEISIDIAESFWVLDKNLKRHIESGTYEIQIGANSQDIKLKGEVSIE